MAGKDKSIDKELDDWAAAIDEWDANLALPSPTGPRPKVDPADLLEPPTEPSPSPDLLAAATAPRVTPPATPAPTTTGTPAATGARREDLSQPLPLDEPPALEQLPQGAADEDPLMHLFDGDMELPEEAGQALGSLLSDDVKTSVGTIEQIAPRPPAAETLEAEEPGLYEEPDFSERTRVASEDEFDKLLADTATIGDVEPPRRTPSARMAIPTPARTAIPTPGGMAAPATPSPAAVEEGPAIELEAATPPPGESGGFGHESTRVANHLELGKILADDAEVEAMLPEPPPSSAPRPSPLLPEPGSKLASGRFARPSERMAIPTLTPPGITPPPGLLPGLSPPSVVPAAPPLPRSTVPVPPPPKPHVPPPEPTDLEVEMELAPAIELVVAADEDFYDDIEVVRGREEPVAASSPEPAAEAAISDEDALFEMTVEGAVDPAARASDPDRTPLPVADADELEGIAPARVPVPTPASIPAVAVSGTLGATPPPSAARPLLAARIARPAGPLPAVIIAADTTVGPRGQDAEYLRDQLALYDTERLLVSPSDGARAARLAYAAGRIAERLGEIGTAIERYEAALERDPQHAHALRGLRRLRLADAKREPVLGMLDRELERAAPAEKRGLQALKAELALALGEREVAAAAQQAILGDQPDDPGALSGALDLAAAGSDDDVAAALKRLSDTLGPDVDATTRAALLVERGRLDEGAGRLREAVARYRDALDVEPGAVTAAWGLLRIAVRTPGVADDLDSHARLLDLLPASPLKQALARRLGRLRAQGSEVAGARPPLQLAAADGDRVALVDLADLERDDGRLEEAASALGRAADAEPDAGRRADLLVALGELDEKLGHTAQAAAAYQRAATDFPEDPRAARALERTQAAGGDKESALRRHLSAAARSPARAPMELLYAARLLGELGRGDEALARLTAALTASPTLGPAIDLAVELHLAGGRVDEAAAVLTRAAEAADEPGLAQAHRLRAARLYVAHQRPADALALVRPLLATLAGSDAARAVRWLEQRILRQLSTALGGAGIATLRESLRAESESDGGGSGGDPARTAAIAYELGISAPDDDEALAELRRALAADPLDGAAAAEIAARLDAERRPGELPAVWSARLAAAGTRPEAVALSLRLGATLLDDARDFAGAARAYGEAERLAPGYPAAREGLDRVAKRGDDTAAQIQALEREQAESDSVEQRFALDLLIGEKLERAQLAPERAAERYRHALELRPQHLLARQALERAYKSARNLSALADLALGDLKEAPDSGSKVAAYERLAYLDGELRGDAQSALLGWESIIEIDHAHHAAMRVLERHYLGEQRWPELVALYEQMGLTAGDSGFAVAVHLDRARLRRRVPELTESECAAAVDNDYRLALFKDRRCRPALRHVYSRARANRELSQLAETATALAEAMGDDTRTAAVMFTRAAEALVELDRMDEARTRYEGAIERQPQHLPALIGLTDFAIAKEDWLTAVHAAERAAGASRDRTGRAHAFLLAAAIAQDKLGDHAHAQALLRATLAVDPRSREAFSRLERLLHELHDFASLAQLYQQRLEIETDGGRLMALHLMLARIARDELRDRDRARAELKSVLSQDPGHPEALAALADLQFDDQQWAEAAETLIRRARAEKSRLALKDIFFKLGLIYSEHLPDPKRAVASFTRVLQVTPDDIVALEHLSNIHVKEWDWKGALQATLRLSELEKDLKKRIAHLHRVAKIYEDGFKDARHALDALRRALELDPMYLSSIGQLATFFDRQSDVQSMRVHLDRTAGRVRSLLDANPLEPGPYHALFKIFNWRRAPDRAAVAAGVLDWLGAADGDERAALAKLTARDNYPGSALADPTLDETLFDARVPAGFRNLFRLLDEPLAKMFRADVKRLGVQRHEKLPRSGNAVRELANRIATDLGVRDFDLYVTATHPTAVVVELTDPLSVVLGTRVVEGAHELELRFLLGRCFKMIQSHMALPMRLTPEDTGLLVGGIVRQFVPDFVPAGFVEAQIVAEAGRMARIIPKKLHGELLPFALECASESLDLKLIGPSLVHTANRAGLLACGLPGPSLTAVRRLSDEAQLRALLRFTVSDELSDLRRQLGTSVG